MRNDISGLYHRHECRYCGRITYDAIPWVACPVCFSGDVEVTFDSQKRAAELARITKCKVASEIGATT